MNKKIKILLTLLLGLMFFFAGLVYAITWKPANQITIGWEPVTLLTDGSAIPAGSVITYRVCISNAITDPNKTNPVCLDDVITGLEKTITFNVEGSFVPGVKAVRSVDGTVVSESIISWYDDVTKTATGEAYGYLYYLAPTEVGGLR